MLSLGWENKCDKCLITSWLGEHIRFQVDHINGDHTDNRLENLRFLCPNCHSQTKTFGSKNRKGLQKHKKVKQIKPNKSCQCGKPIKKDSNQCEECYHITRRKVERPTKESLNKLMWECPATEISKRFNVSDTTISKWCKFYGILKPARGYWTKIKHGHMV